MKYKSKRFPDPGSGKDFRAAAGLLAALESPALNRERTVPYVTPS